MHGRLYRVCVVIIELGPILIVEEAVDAVCAVRAILEYQRRVIPKLVYIDGWPSR